MSDPNPPMTDAEVMAMGFVRVEDGSWVRPSANRALSIPPNNSAIAQPLATVPSARPRVPDKDGAALLDEVREILSRFIVFPRPEAADAYALWIAATHAQTEWEHATRFVFKSPIRRCGKTRAQEIGRELIHRPISTTNISVAALVRAIDETDPPTLVLDEADAIFGRGKETREGAEDLQGIINSGHSRGWPYIRWDMKARQAEECPTFAMALLGGIGDMPDTIEDRALVVSMRRRAPNERVSQFRRRRVVPGLHLLRDRLHAWITSLDGLADADPDVPVEDRDADKWESLIVVADSAGGHWPATARAACESFCRADAPDQETAGERLLVDLRDLWGANEDHLGTNTILERLHALDEAPWGDWYGKPLSARGLAKLLKPYQVTSGTIRVGAATPKGYARADLADCWLRYATSATPPQGAEIGALTSDDGCGARVADTDSESATCLDLREQADCGPVPDVADEGVERVREAALSTDDVAAWELARLAALDPADPEHGEKVALIRAETVHRKREVAQ